MRGEGAPQQPRAHSVAAVHHQNDLMHRASPLSHVDASPEWQGQYPYPAAQPLAPPAQGAMGYMPESMHRSASPVSPLPQLLPSYGRSASPMVATHLLSPATTTGVKHVSTPSLVRGAGSPETMQGHNGFTQGDLMRTSVHSAAYAARTKRQTSQRCLGRGPTGPLSR